VMTAGVGGIGLGFTLARLLSLGKKK
jgi:hypothetical protein